MSSPPTTRFRGLAWCHVPADEPVRLGALVSNGESDDDRWNGQGEPTVYLATDPAIALAELARHLDVSPGAAAVRRRVLGLSVDVDGLLDLRRGDVRKALGGPATVEAFREREVARAVARRARGSEATAGLLVPSMAFPDDPARANLVLFLEHLGGDFDALVRERAEFGAVEIRPPAAE